MGKTKRNGSNSKNKNVHDGVQVLNNEVEDAHHIESATLSNGLFGVEIEDNLIDADTRYFI